MESDVNRQEFLLRHLTMSSNPRFRLTAAGLITGIVLAIPHIQLPSDGQVTLLGHPAPLMWHQNDADLTIDLPESMASSPAYTLKIKPWSEAQKRK